MWTHSVPSLLMPSPRTRNSGNAVCKKWIMPSMSRTQRFAYSSRTVIAYLQCGLSPLRLTRIDCRTGVAQESHSRGRRIPLEGFLTKMNKAPPSVRVRVRRLPQHEDWDSSSFGEARLATASLLLRYVEVSSPVLQLVIKAGFGGLTIGRDRHLEDADHLAVTLISFLQHVLAHHLHRHARDAHAALPEAVISAVNYSEVLKKTIERCRTTGRPR